MLTRQLNERIVKQLRELFSALLFLRCDWCPSVFLRAPYMFNVFPQPFPILSACSLIILHLLLWFACPTSGGKSPPEDKAMPVSVKKRSFYVSLGHVTQQQKLRFSPDSVLCKLIFQLASFSGGVFLFTDNGMLIRTRTSAYGLHRRFGMCCVFCAYIYIYIYIHIYIYIERERYIEREICISIVCISMYTAALGGGRPQRRGFSVHWSTADIYTYTPII